MKRNIPIWWLIPFALLLFTIAFLWQRFVSDTPEIVIDTAAITKPISDLGKSVSVSEESVLALTNTTKELDSRLKSITEKRPPSLNSTNFLTNSVKRKVQFYFTSQNNAIESVRNDVRELGRRVTVVQSQLTNIDSRVSEAIRKTEDNIENIHVEPKPKTAETTVVLLGLIASISGMLIAWRKDSRDSRKHTKEMADSAA